MNMPLDKEMMREKRDQSMKELLYDAKRKFIQPKKANDKTVIKTSHRTKIERNIPSRSAVQRKRHRLHSFIPSRSSARVKKHHTL